MVRVIAGRFRGLKLKAPDGLKTRPTRDQVKEALFSMLASLSFDFEGARVLDCFAGSGGLAIEALSRGASFAALVEADPRAMKIVEGNVGLLRAEMERNAGGPWARLIRAPWPRALDEFRDDEPFTLFFLDPPYQNTALPQTLLREAAMRGLAAPGALAVWEQAPASLETWGEAETLPWRLLKTRVRGGQALAILEYDKEKHNEK